jgi:hypothetical protein
MRIAAPPDCRQISACIEELLVYGHANAYDIHIGDDAYNVFENVALDRFDVGI